MTWRILLAQLGLLVLILLGAVVPMGLAAAAADQQAYVDAAAGSARSLAAIAEEKVDDKAPDPQLPGQLTRAARVGDGVELVTRSGAVLARAGDPAAADRSLSLALAGRTVAGWQGDGAGRRLVVAVPVGGRLPPVGAVLLTRSAQPLNHAVHQLWLQLAALAAAAGVAAAVVALGLTRWVVRPVRRLEAAARAFGEADLSARAVPVPGPPEVTRLADTFNAMAGQLQTMVRGQQGAIADASHQLRTPLAAIRLRLELLADEAPDSHTGSEVRATLRELARLSRLVDGMLAVARAENAERPPQPVRVDLVIAERVAAWQPVAEEARVALARYQTVDQTGALTATMSSGQLEQVLDNVLDNAITATLPGGNVLVGATCDGEWIRVVVSDDGPGMTTQQMADAFHRFSGDRHGGTGLGLAIVHRMITSEHGRVQLGIATSGGLSVTLELPQLRADRDGPSVSNRVSR